MKCPSCSGAVLVLQTRASGNRTRRRYRCKDCEARFSTLELTEDEVGGLENGVAHGKAVEAVVGRMVGALKALGD